MSTEFDVVIVGGGAAGIGAARTLAASSCSTLLLEASSRLGGRAWTYEIAWHPLDLGCGWLHSGDRNSWANVAKEAGLAVDRRPAKWGVQHRHLGFSPREQQEAGEAFDAWFNRLSVAPPPSDRAADALPPGGEWNAYLEAISGFISGAPLERVSIADYLAYDSASTGVNWRAPHGYGDLIVASLPFGAVLRLSTPVEAIELEVVGEGPFAPETHVLGNPRDRRTATYTIRPFGRPVIECFFGGEGAEMIEESGPTAGFDYAIGQLIALFGSDARRNLKPLIASSWSRTTRIGGAYSYALPGRAAARQALARSFADRLFFAGEATSAEDFSTAHGAHDSGVRAAEEALAALRSRSGVANR